MREIRPEGTPYFYFSAVDPVPGESYQGMRLSYFDLFMRDQFPDATDVRLVLVPSRFRAKEIWVYFLHWDDGIDLIELDHRVENGASNDDDFRHSAKTVYQITRCDYCGRGWHALVIP